MNKKIGSIIMILSIAFILSSCQETVINDNLEGKAGEHVGTLNGYDFYREVYTCDLFVGNITIDNYNFGYFRSACGNSIGDIGYEVKKDDKTYNLNELVDNGELKTKDIYRKIYLPDPFKKGEL